MNGTFIIGKATTGKSRLARYLGRNSKTQTIDGRELAKMLKPKGPFFINISAETELLIIDDYPIKHIKDLFYLILPEFIIIERQGKPAITVEPKLIITCECSIGDLPPGGSFHQRFTVIECIANMTHIVEMFFHHPECLDQVFATKPIAN